MGNFFNALVMINTGVEMIRHIISGICRKFTPHTRAMGRFMDVVKSIGIKSILSYAVS